MGTNYYLHKPKKKDICKDCPYYEQHKDILHIGKSSGGWCFSLHVIPEEDINTLDDWIKLFCLPNYKIFDENRDKISIDDMLRIIRDRSHQHSRGPSFDYERNYAEPGPNNLVRYKIDGRHCIGHGDGTWDLIIGEFS